MTDIKRLADKILAGKDSLDSLLGHLRGKITIADKTLSEWREHFHITVPTDLNTITCKELGTQLMNLYQEASFFSSMAEIKLHIAKSATDETVRDAYYRLVEEHKEKYGKVPAAATLESLARSQSSDILNAQVLAEIEKEFWKKIIDQLNYCRKMVENATMNIAIEQKGMRDKL